jgi:ABC-type branched-subunit amino acid transport system substrate-binding protein
MIGHAAAVVAAAAAATSTPGVTASTITIGGTAPLSGPAAAFASVARGSEAYFEYVNARGGVHRRKIVYRYFDDAYDPARTVQLTQRLVEQEHVLALFDTVGTDNALAIRQYVNDRKVPDLFVGSGVSKIATEHAKYPWTIGRARRSSSSSRTRTSARICSAASGAASAAAARSSRSCRTRRRTPTSRRRSRVSTLRGQTR